MGRPRVRLLPSVETPRPRAERLSAPPHSPRGRRARLGLRGTGAAGPRDPPRAARPRDRPLREVAEISDPAGAWGGAGVGRRAGAGEYVYVHAPTAYPLARQSEQGLNNRRHGPRARASRLRPWATEVAAAAAAAHPRPGPSASRRRSLGLDGGGDVRAAGPGARRRDASWGGRGGGGGGDGDGDGDAREPPARPRPSGRAADPRPAPAAAAPARPPSAPVTPASRPPRKGPPTTTTTARPTSTRPAAPAAPSACPVWPGGDPRPARDGPRRHQAFGSSDARRRPRGPPAPTHPRPAAPDKGVGTAGRAAGAGRGGRREGDGIKIRRAGYPIKLDVDSRDALHLPLDDSPRTTLPLPACCARPPTPVLLTLCMHAHTEFLMVRFHCGCPGTSMPVPRCGHDPPLRKMDGGRPRRPLARARARARPPLVLGPEQQ